MKLHHIIYLLTIGLSVLLTACSSQNKTDFDVNYEKFTLDNGLEVIFHEDKSDPVTAVALTFHVGSAREVEGKTGFAHLFEHLLFLESENLGKGGLDEMSSRIGGSGANGSTSRDRTNYFQTVPNDALEKMIWAEADKLGFFINTVTENVVAKEKQVVKNEKRQGVDNAPYGHVSYVVGKNLYPKNHPYNWQVIGSLEDLQNATLQDVKEFYEKWYVPNNATLVIAGDFDKKQAKKWVHKYFDDIPRGDDIKTLEKQAVSLENTKKLYYEDNFARLPELRYTWPTVEMYHKDSYALDILAKLLSSGKKSPFNKVIVEDKQLSSSVFLSNYSSELAGEASLVIRANPGTDLDDVATAVNQAFQKFEDESFTESDLNRIKAGIETQFYQGLASVLGKAFQLAQYNIFADDPGFASKDIENTLNVTKEDIMRVYEKYIKDKYYVQTSFVPKGAKDLAISGSTLADVVEEEITDSGEDESFAIESDSSYERTPSSFDRTVEPPYGKSPTIKVPEIWTSSLNNGVDVYGIENDELPLVEFRLQINGGLLLEDIDKTGVSNLMSQLLTKGTANKTPEELEEEIDKLGARISVRSGKESITISGTTLERNYDKTMALVEEILLEPRWDENEFKLVKQSIKSQILQQAANPNSIASTQFDKLLYGEDSILAQNIAGTTESIEQITIEDLKGYYNNYISPNVSNFHVVGSIKKNKVLSSLSKLENNWADTNVELPEINVNNNVESSKVYFYDVPNAKQSVFRFGYPALAETDADFYPATVMNYILGGGGFASRLTQELREGKGYTYGIGSGFSGSKITGPFTISSSVRTNITYQAAALVKQILEQYPTTFTEDDLSTTKSFLLKSNARSFETMSAKLGILQKISSYGWSPDYIKERENIVENITQEDIQKLAEKYIQPDKMIWLIVGDAKSQLHKLEELGFGAPVLLNE